MKLYFAGNFAGVSDVENLKQRIQYKLYSYHNEQKPALNWGSNNLILDSGAFSAFTLGKVINHDEYLSFLNDFKPEHAIQLDVIGDDNGTWKNWLYAEKKYPTLPVIHYMSEAKHIKRILESDAPYICLGGLVPYSKQKKKLFDWLDYVYSFKKIRDKKVHCLGIMSEDTLSKYPFYSADSSSALNIVRYPAKDLRLKFLQKTKKDDRWLLLDYTIKEQLDLEKKVTALWTARGFYWE